MSQTSQLFSFPPSGLPPPSRSWRVKGQGKDHLGSRGSSTCRANPRRGPVGSKAFWDEITQTQRILEKAPPHSLHKSDPQEGLEARGHHGESLRTPEVDAPISSLVALSFLNSFCSNCRCSLDSPQLTVSLVPVLRNLIANVLKRGGGGALTAFSKCRPIFLSQAWCSVNSKASKQGPVEGTGDAGPAALGPASDTQDATVTVLISHPPRFTDENTEALKWEGTCPKSHDKTMTAQRGPGSWAGWAGWASAWQLPGRDRGVAGTGGRPVALAVAE